MTARAIHPSLTLYRLAALAALGFCLLWPNAATGGELRFSFEGATDAWVASPLDGNTGEVAPSTERASAGDSSLSIAATFPGSVGITYHPIDDFTGFGELALDLFVPEDAPEDLDLYIYLKDKEYRWYQTAPLKATDTGLPRSRKWGAWRHIAVPLDGSAPIWEAGDQMAAWGRATYRPHELGLRLFSNEQWSGPIYVDEIALRPLGRAPAPGRREWQAPPGGISTPTPGGAVAPDEAPSRSSLRLIPSADSVPQFERFELTFYLDRIYDNPFDPGEINVQGHFVGPSGKEVTVPGFYYQAYARMRDGKRNEQLSPAGTACWKVRFAPLEQGPHRYWVTVQEGPPEWIRRTRPATVRRQLESALSLRGLASLEGAFTATEPKDPRGYLRVSTSDPRYFEFQNGDFYFPWGVNMRDGGDQAAAQQGTYDFDGYLAEFAAHGFNFVRTWMCAWWAGLEWSERYESRYYGEGRYALYNAWRLDHALEQAEANDLYVELTFNNHGQVRRDRFDQEWEYSPYGVRNAGHLPAPPLLFSDERTKELFKRRYRYIVARWGYSRHIFSWDLWNEVDLVENYYEPEVCQFNQEMAQYLRSIDPWDHIISTHMCLYWFGGLHGATHGSVMWQAPEMQIVKADSYWGSDEYGPRNNKRPTVEGAVCNDVNDAWFMGYGMNQNDRTKPFLFIEWGKQTQHNVFPDDADMRIGLWVTYMQPAAALGVSWHWPMLEKHGWYALYEALGRFDGGFDRRGHDLKNTAERYLYVRGLSKEDIQLDPEVRAEQRGSCTARPAEAMVHCQAMQTDTEAHFYAYNYPHMKKGDPAKVEQPVTGVTVTFRQMKDGAYSVEFWDPLRGEKFGNAQATCQGGKLSFVLPDFRQDIAGKIRPGA